MNLSQLSGGITYEETNTMRKNNSVYEGFWQHYHVAGVTDLGCTRLASRVTDLKKRGYNIKSEFVSGKNRYDETVSYKKYYLGGTHNATTQTGT